MNAYTTNLIEENMLFEDIELHCDALYMTTCGKLFTVMVASS